jgi:two-component system, OmpR family, phosphate regulon response regulator PhoB
MILVADDHADVRFMVESVLRRSGFDVELAADGEEALTRARERLPELVVLDILMPLMSGLEVLVQLRGSPATRAIPVILLTAKGLGKEAAAAFDLGADYYIAKPFEAEQLLSGVRTLLPQRRVG